MIKLNISKMISLKNLDSKEVDFLNRIINKGGQFTNEDLAKFWGTKTLPKKIKAKLLNEPPILKLVQQRPQKYILISENSTIETQIKKQEELISEGKEKILNRFYQEIQDLKREYLQFKEDINLKIKDIFHEIKILKSTINRPLFTEKISDLIIHLSELEKEILITYNRLKIRPHQPIKIEDIWAQINIKYPNFNWEAFSNQILKIHSNNFHLEEGSAGHFVIDPVNNKKYSYVIGN